MQPSSRKFAGLIVTDLDGTLMRTGGGFSAVDLEALEKAGRLGFARVIATGRSLHSFYKAVDFAMPIDFLIFSTGGGVLDCSGGKILRQINMEASSVAAAIQTLKGFGLDFMAHDPIPDNHGFAYHSTGRTNADFDRRLALYSAYCRLLDGAGDFGEAAQLLAILPDADISVLPRIRRKLDGLNVIRTTSPLDGRSTWIEIFPPQVSKGLAAAWLADFLGIHPEKTLGIGNDYNDLDMLRWAAAGMVVDNAPEDLKARFPAVASNNHGGVADAVDRWLLKRGSGRLSSR